MEKSPEVEKKIELFIKAVKGKIPAIKNIIYEYNDSVQSYLIWHDLVPNEENKYQKELGTLIYDYLFKNGIYDISFAYKSDIFSELSIDAEVSHFSIKHSTNQIECFSQESLQSLLVTTLKDNEPFLARHDIAVSNGQDNIQLGNLAAKVLLYDDAIINFQENYGQGGLAA